VTVKEFQPPRGPGFDSLPRKCVGIIAKEREMETFSIP